MISGGVRGGGGGKGEKAQGAMVCKVNDSQYKKKPTPGYRLRGGAERKEKNVGGKTNAVWKPSFTWGKVLRTKGRK